MKKEEKLKIREVCMEYLEELDKDPMTGPNCWNADSLTLGIMLKLHPSFAQRLDEELKANIRKDELYDVFKENVLSISEEKGWNMVLTLEKSKVAFLPGDYDFREKNGGLKHTGGISQDEYKAAADEFLQMWKDFIGINKPKIR